MTKIYTKLIAVALALVLSVSMVVMSSYAWFILTSSPEVSEIQVIIGGGNTILVAPDVTRVVDGKVLHYPGYFSDTLNFSQYDTYDYLQELGGLTPVSTADGVNWFLPTYYDTTDNQVQLGKVPSGQLKDVSQFKLDDSLSYANLARTEVEKISQGSYVYLDFWVVSPGSEYTLRVSTGDDTGGSFVIDLQEPAQTDSGYTLASTASQGGSATASVRIGFLAGVDRVTDGSMEAYQNTHAFDSRYTQLRGVYQENSDTQVYGNYRFCIYEPNADLHPQNPAMNGSYVITNPVAMVNGTAREVDVSSVLTVQKTSAWAPAVTGSGTELEQRFQTALLGMNWQGMSGEEISEAFYNSYLQGQVSPYVQTGDFIKRTSELYLYGDIVQPEQLSALDAAGATDDVYIVELERNVPQRIRLFIWLEGQDIDCVNGLLESSFALNIELAGSNQED